MYRDVYFIFFADICKIYSCKAGVPNPWATAWCQAAVHLEMGRASGGQAHKHTKLHLCKGGAHAQNHHLSSPRRHWSAELKRLGTPVVKNGKQSYDFLTWGVVVFAYKTVGKC